MPTNQISVVVTDGATETATCSQCNSPTCLALLRADTPPSGWADFFDRQIKLIASGHWGWAPVGYCAALAGIGVFVGLIVVLLFVVVGPVVGGISGLVTGTGLFGGGMLLRWLRNRGNGKDSPPVAPISPLKEHPSGDTPPVRVA